jgi:hypothetical protein
MALAILCGINPCCDFNCQQTGDSIGKFVFNRFRTHNSWFRRPRKANLEDITRTIMQQGEVRGFNGKMTGNLGIAHEKC